MLKTITHPVTGKQFRMGRTIPIARAPRLSLGNYVKTKPHKHAPLDPNLPAPPESWGYHNAAAAALKEVYLNDQLGDCVIAGMAHLEGVFTAASTGKPQIFTDDQITSMYSAIGQYKPGDPKTDNGCDEQTALHYWHDTGFCGHKIVGLLAVDATNKQECVLASWLFANLIFGVCMPDKWVNPMPDADGFTWDVAGEHNVDNGHCFVSARGNQKWGVTVETWGMSGLLTWDAIEKYAAPSAEGELYTVLTKEIIKDATQKAPNGVDWTQLQADFAAIGVDMPL